MGTVTSFLQSARYDLIDYGTGLEFDDRELIDFLNRMIRSMDSTLAALNSELVHGTETNIDTVADQDYVDLTHMNNGNWDSIRSVWNDDDIRMEKIGLDFMMYKRKFITSSLKCNYWTPLGRQILFEGDMDAAYTGFIVHYNKKTRPLLQSYSTTFTAATTDIVTMSANHTFVNGDGPFQLTNSGGALPGGLSTSTNYYVYIDPSLFDSNSQTQLKLASSKVNALEGSVVDITGTGTGTHTMAFTSSTDIMPYDGIYDDLFREMLVLHASLTSFTIMYLIKEQWRRLYERVSFPNRIVLISNGTNTCTGNNRRS
jgi:hypothetical protein